MVINRESLGEARQNKRAQTSECHAGERVSNAGSTT